MTWLVSTSSLNASIDPYRLPETWLIASSTTLCSLRALSSIRAPFTQNCPSPVRRLRFTQFCGMPISWITESRTAADLAQTDVSLEVGGIERHKVAPRRTAEASDGSLAFVTNFIVSLGLSEAQGARPIGRTTVRNNFGAPFQAHTFAALPSPCAAVWRDDLGRGSEANAPRMKAGQSLNCLRTGEPGRCELRQACRARSHGSGSRVFPRLSMVAFFSCQVGGTKL